MSAAEPLAISPTCHPCVVIVFHFEILLVLGMTSDFQSKPGHFEFPKTRSYFNLLFYLVSSLTAPEGGRSRPRSCQVEGEVQFLILAPLPPVLWGVPHHCWVEAGVLTPLEASWILPG